MNQSIFIITASISAILTIYGKYLKDKLLHIVFKPLTLIIIICFALWGNERPYDVFKIFIIIALFFSLIGDLLLMLYREKFVFGIAAFLFTHIFYSLAFIQNTSLNLYLLIPFILFAIVFYRILRDNLGKLKIPVRIYTIIIVLMGWLACNRYLFFEDAQSFIVLTGGILFMLSDSILAVNKFKKEFKSAEVLILTSYFCSQILFALSL